MYELDGADIDTACRLTDQKQDVRLRAPFPAPDTSFCWLPPEKFAVFRRGFGGRTSNSSINPSVASMIALRLVKIAMPLPYFSIVMVSENGS